MAAVNGNLKKMPKTKAIDQVVNEAINEPRRRASRYDANFLEVLTISAKNCVAVSKFVVLKRYCSQGGMPPPSARIKENLLNGLFKRQKMEVLELSKKV